MATEAPAPVTPRRVADELTRQGYAFRVGGDGVLTGTWDGHRLWFLLLGDERGLLQVRGRAARTTPVEHHDALVQVLNDWNRDGLWPAAHAREEQGVLLVYGEVSTPFELGATDAQLAHAIRTGVAGCLALFEALDSLVRVE
ncbi:YbjN domain-containing protein [Paraoerskovia marina]|uniref:YbjN domain-containing protein n=1 Tax=Paraoerskovia marina TaxID=545619 RepID=UPI00138E0FE5|nr:YbjN domain-containing protein [Paraoerskovia marina]